MNGAFQHLIAPVYRYEGTLARLMGDAILSFFGAPIAHEDDPQRAVLAGLEIIRGMRSYGKQVRDKWGLDFNVRVGINTGLVVVGEVGSDLRVEYTALGDAVNMAARMEQKAEPGTVQITQDTHKLIAPLFEFEDLGGLQVKGKDEPVPAYRVLGQKAQPGRLRGLEEKGIDSPLVGRTPEFEAVTSCVERLSNGQGGIVLVIGEAGLGKSRLMSEVLRHSRDTNGRTPPQWLEGHTLSFGQTISYWPFQEILRQNAGITENDSETGTWDKLESSVGALFGERSAEVLPYLASLLSLEVRDEYAERVKYLDSEALGRQVFRASRLFFERLAQERPLAVVFEDLHWMDESSARLLEHLLPMVKRVPLLVCCITRPDSKTPGARVREIGAKEYAESYTEVVLAPLSLSRQLRAGAQSPGNRRPVPPECDR